MGNELGESVQGVPYDGEIICGTTPLVDTQPLLPPGCTDIPTGVTIVVNDGNLEVSRNKMYAEIEKYEECDSCLEHKRTMAFMEEEYADHYSLHLCADCLRQQADVLDNYGGRQ